jgi:hypothetical protein
VVVVKKPPKVHDGLSSLKSGFRLGDDHQTLFDRIAEEVVHGDRDLFDSLSPHERKLVVDWLSTAIVDGPDNVISSVLWEVDYIRTPVSVETFLTDEHYFGKKTRDLHDNWMKDLKTVLDFNSPYTEWIFTGSIGTGKTTVGDAALGYKLYLMSCLRDPAKYYGLLPEERIYFGIYSITRRQVADSGYYKLRAMLDSSPYFRFDFPRNKSLDSMIEFKGAPLAVLTGSQSLHALGVDMFAFLMDEVNFMRVREDEAGEVTGQAYDLYNATSARLLSRFSRPGGTVPGISILISSRNTHTSFLEDRIEKVRDSPACFISDYKLWECKPKHRFPSIWGMKAKVPAFDVFVGDRTTNSRIMDVDEKPKPGQQIVRVPGELRPRFEEDINQALRDLAGVSTYGVNPLITERQSIFDAIRDQLQHPFTNEEITLDFRDDYFIEDAFKLKEVCQVKDSKWVARLNPGCPRFMHVDLSTSGDCAGMSMCHMSGMKSVIRRRDDGTESREESPFILADFMLRIRPPKGSQIDLSKIRAFILYLRKFYNIELVTFDGYQSADSIQILWKQSMLAKLLSVDRDDTPYVSLRAAHYERRIGMYKYGPYIDEILDLERDVQKSKVDHPMKNSKGGKGCFAGSTKVSLLDGREVSLADLAKNPGEEVYVYTIRDGAVSAAVAVKPRLTKRRARTVVVTLDNGEAIVCTPDHRFMLRDGSYVDAATLAAGSSLMPLYRCVADREGLSGYELYLCPKDGRWHFTHRMVGKLKYGRSYTGNQYGRGVIHHARGKRNNDPRFLSLESPSSHAQAHAEDLRRRRADPVFERRRRRAAVAYARSQEGRARSAANMRRLNADPAFASLRDARAAALGGRTGTANITAYNRSAKHRRDAAERGRVTIHKAIEACCRRDVTLVAVVGALKAPGATQKSAARALGCSPSLIRLRLRQANHRVVSVAPGPVCDVFDLSVPGTENFALSAGVFVHNSKDVSDSLCGAVWNCLNSETAIKAAPPVLFDGTPRVPTRVIDPGDTTPNVVIDDKLAGLPPDVAAHVASPRPPQQGPAPPRPVNGTKIGWDKLRGNLRN